MTGTAVTTAAELVRLAGRRRQPGPAVRVGRVVVAPGGGRVRATGAPCCRELRRDGPFHVGRPPREHARVPLPAGRRGPGRRGRRRHQPHPPGRRAGRRHHQDRLPAGHHRLGPACASWTASTWDSDPDRMLIADSDDYREPARPPRPVGAAAGAADRPTISTCSSSPRGRPAGPKAVRMTQGGPPGPPPAWGSPATTSSTRPCPCSTATPCRPRCSRPWPAGPPWPSGAASRPRACSTTSVPSGATYFNTVGRAISHLVATPADRARPGPPAPLRARTGDVGGRQGRVHRAVRRPPLRGVRVERERHRPAAGRPTPVPAPSAGPATATTSPWSTPTPARSGRRAVFDADGRLANPAEAIGELVGRAALANFEGYYNNPEAEAERTRNGWYWSGDLGLPRRGGDLLLRRPHRRLAPGRQRELRRRARSSGSSAGSPASGGWPSTPSPTAGPATRSWRPLEMEPERRASTRSAFAAFLAAQPDLGTKWAPRYVRIVDALPVTATDKVDKRPLGSALWRHRTRSGTGWAGATSTSP